MTDIPLEIGLEPIFETGPTKSRLRSHSHEIIKSCLTCSKRNIEPYVLNRLEIFESSKLYVRSFLEPGEHVIGHYNIGVEGFGLNRFLGHQNAQTFIQRIGIVLFKVQTFQNFQASSERLLRIS